MGSYGALLPLPDFQAQIAENEKRKSENEAENERQMSGVI
jgi:hypothetical protein